MIQVTEALHAELEKTASHLASRKVVVKFQEYDPGGACGFDAQTMQLTIVLDPRVEIGKLYHIFLHECGHALQKHWQFADKPALERAANIQASVWMGSVAQCLPEDFEAAKRLPKDMDELMRWLKILRRFGKDKQTHLTIESGGLIYGILRPDVAKSFEEAGKGDWLRGDWPKESHTEKPNVSGVDDHE